VKPDLYAVFAGIPEACRMLCIDAVAVALYLDQHGQPAAGLKLLRTALMTGGIDPDLSVFLLKNRQKTLAALAVHAEIRNLF
jgi:hypothetical protein